MITHRLKFKLLIDEASKWVGVKEEKPNWSPQIEVFQKEVDGKSNREPWCVSFIQYCVNQVDRDVSKTYWQGNDYQPNQLYKTEHVLTLWSKTPLENRVETPFPGCVVLFWQFSEDGKPTGAGHAEIVKEVLTEGRLKTIGGNTSDGASINRDGDGVYERIRKPPGSYTFRLLGYLNPWHYPDETS